MQRRALITGITGQDGSYLAELLLANGYTVYGLVRRVALENPDTRLARIAHIKHQLHLEAGDVQVYGDVYNAIERVQPSECYHLAAQSDVARSFTTPAETLNTNIMGTLNVLESVRITCHRCRVYFAGSSEMFGEAKKGPQTEDTAFAPVSPYGVSKVAGFHLAAQYRVSYDMHISCGILFNHESPRRGMEFVTRKITRAVAMIAAGKQEALELGNLQANRDWGFAGDYVQAMWLMLQQPFPDDFVVASGETHSVQEFVTRAFEVAGLDWTDHVSVNESLYRPRDIWALWGNARKARAILQWRPDTSFVDLVRMMVESDRKQVVECA